MSRREKRALLSLAVILLGASPLLLSSCGVTADQRFWDATFDHPTRKSLHTPEMQAAIDEARK